MEILIGLGIIDSAFVPRVTAQNSPSRLDYPFEKTVFTEGFFAVFTAGRVKPAHSMGEKCAKPRVVGRKGFLVQPNQAYAEIAGNFPKEEQKFFHEEILIHF